VHIPALLWRETAVLVRDMGDGGRRIAGEGSLFEMVKRISSLSDAEWPRYAINLPDRRAAPFLYTPEEFGSLLYAQVQFRG
jgi:hypothetical protein